MRSWKYRVKMSLRGCSLRPRLRLCLFEEEFCLDLFGFLIALPFMDRWRREPHEIMEAWGIYYFESSLVICFGRSSKYIYMPWMWDHCKTEVRRADGSWVPYVASYDEGKEPDGRELQTFSYRYTLRSGEVQEATATVHAERRTWKWRMFPWLPWPRKVRQDLDVHFDREMGERAGSWKGGCIGCGWDMQPSESMEQTLRRMEAERVFR